MRFLVFGLRESADGKFFVYVRDLQKFLYRVIGRGMSVEYENYEVNIDPEKGPMRGYEDWGSVEISSDEIFEYMKKEHGDVISGRTVQELADIVAWAVAGFVEKIVYKPSIYYDEREIVSIYVPKFGELSDEDELERLIRKRFLEEVELGRIQVYQK